jgi:hypothetical protein
MEFIEIDGVPVPVPADVVSDGREAIAAWAATHAKRKTTTSTTAKE